MSMGRSGSWFTRFAQKTARATGRPAAFILAFGVILAWGITGPLFGFSDTWQLVINTGTTIVTFLMVFLIQNTQNRDTGALQIKLDELIRATRGAHDALLDLEELDEATLQQVRETYSKLAKRAREERRRGGTDTGVWDVDEIDFTGSTRKAGGAADAVSRGSEPAGDDVAPVEGKPSGLPGDPPR